MAVIVSGGRLRRWPTGEVQGRMTFRSSRTLELLGEAGAVAYSTIYDSQPWVYAVVNKIARNIARLPLRAYRLDDDDDTMTPIRRSTGHPLPALLSRPYPRATSFHLVERTLQQLACHGHSLTWKYRQRPGQPPIELYPIDWRYVTLESDKGIDYYEYQGPLGRKIFLADDVIHLTWASPKGPAGTSPLEPLRQTLVLEDAAKRYQAASFRNGIRPSGALTTEKTLSPEEKRELRAEVAGGHSEPDQAFRFMLLDGGLTWAPFSQTAADAQLVDTRKLGHLEVCAAYDMPPTMLQILDHATFGNIDEQHQMLYVDTFGPWFGNLENTFYAQLLWGEPLLQFAETEEGEMQETWLAFDLTELLRPDILKHADAIQKLRLSGVMTGNEGRGRLGLKKHDHPAADALLIPLNMEAIGDGDDDMGLAPRKALTGTRVAD